MPIRRRTLVAAVTCTAAVAMVGGVAVASIPAAGGVIHGCYAKSSGALKVVDSKKKCPHGTKKLNWNATGKTGKTGKTGAAGKTGPQGPGAVLLHYVTNTKTPGLTSVTLATVHGWTFAGQCTTSRIIGGGTPPPVTRLTVTPPAGTTVQSYGSEVVVSSDDPSATETLDLDSAGPVTSRGVSAAGLGVETEGDVPQLILEASKGPSFAVNVRVLTDDRATKGPGHSECMINGTATPIG